MHFGIRKNYRILFGGNWHENGLKYLHQLYSYGKIIPFTELRQIYNLNNNSLMHQSIMRSIPLIWKTSAIENIAPIDNVKKIKH
jgi:hypothetical protein